MASIPEYVQSLMAQSKSELAKKEARQEAVAQGVANHYYGATEDFAPSPTYGAPYNPPASTIGKPTYNPLPSSGNAFASVGSTYYPIPGDGGVNSPGTGTGANAGSGAGSYGGGGSLYQLPPMINTEGYGSQSFDELFSSLAAGRDANIAQQEAALKYARDTELHALQTSLSQAIADGEVSVREAEKIFQENSKLINQKAYEDSKALASQATELGINHSNQRMGMEQTLLANRAGLINENMSDRDVRITGIKDRLAEIKRKTELDSGLAESRYQYGLADAKAQAEMAYQQNVFDVKKEDLFLDKKLSQEFALMDRNQQYNIQNMQIAFQNDLAKMAQQHQYSAALQNQAVEKELHLYMEKASFEIEKAAQAQANEMAKEYAKYYDTNSQEYKIRVAQDKANLSEYMQGVTMAQIGDELAKINSKIIGGEQIYQPKDFGFAPLNWLMGTSDALKEYEKQQNYINWGKENYEFPWMSDEGVIQKQSALGALGRKLFSGGLSPIANTYDKTKSSLR